MNMSDMRRSEAEGCVMYSGAAAKNSPKRKLNYLIMTRLFVTTVGLGLPESGKYTEQGSDMVKATRDRQPD